MKRIMVAGVVNVETSLRVEGFPLTYAPVLYPFGGVRSTVAGVGFNLALALHTLGDAVTLLALLGDDPAGELARLAARRAGLDTAYLEPALAETPQSVVIYDQAGRRQIHTDLKDVQTRTYPPARFAAALAGCQAAILGNVNFNRPFLSPTKAAGKLLVTDVHAIADLEDAYNRDFMAAADVLFVSDARLPETPEAWARAVQARYGTPIVVIGLGAEGALLAVQEDGFSGRFPAVATRPVVNTVGAGDALLAAFVHGYLATADPYRALRQALVFASYKIGARGAAEGFLTAAALARMVG